MTPCDLTVPWVSDYAQFYLVDSEARGIANIEVVGDHDFARGFNVAPDGLAIYTQDALRQEIRFRVYDRAPPVTTADAVSGDAWTKTAETQLSFPSGRCYLTSPSQAGNPVSAALETGTAPLLVRIHWLEYPEDRYDAERAKPDVFLVELWPA
jgi:hypothetical protein